MTLTDIKTGNFQLQSLDNYSNVTRTVKAIISENDKDVVFRFKLNKEEIDRVNLLGEVYICLRNIDKDKLPAIEESLLLEDILYFDDISDIDNISNDDIIDLYREVGG